MSSLATGKRALRASASSLTRVSRATSVTVNCRNQRLFQDSGKKDAVHANNSTPLQGAVPEVPASALGNVRDRSSAIRSAASETMKNLKVPHGQLDVREQAMKPEFYEAVSKIMGIRETYLEKKAVFLKSHEMIPLLRGLGATIEDIAAIQNVSDHLYNDPTLPFRRTRNGRFCIDFDTMSVRRLEFQPFALSAEEDFKRHDSGQIRRFDEIENNLQLNTAYQALMVFHAMVITGVRTAHRPKLDYNWNKFVLTLFNTRTVTTPEIRGEPALEGVHSDGVDHTMTTFLGSKNMAPHSAATYMHHMDETTGVQLNDAKPENILNRVQHNELLDTLVIADHENKHSLSPVYAIDETKEATRDMLVFFTRKPVERDHISGSIDSLTPHEHLPMEIPLFVPTGKA